MSKSTLFGRPSLLRKKARAIKSETNGASESPQVRQPLSDGSEEFFEEFTPESRNQKQDPHTRDILVGLGVTAGVLLGIGATLWLRKKKSGRKKWQRWFA
ncbi:MAG: hypothetical protein AAB354_10875 [candidate division KSB1 bacterium]